MNIDFAIVDQLDDNLPQQDGHFFILLETNDGCGYMEVGKAIARLEDVQTGLGVSFYIVLMDTMWNWMYAYDVSAADYFFDRWRESIEMDIDGDDDTLAELNQEEALQAYCKKNDIEFPDLKEATPACLREVIFGKERKRLKRHRTLLEAYRSGPHADLIDPVLKMAAIPERGKSKLKWQDMDGIWTINRFPTGLSPSRSTIRSHRLSMRNAVPCTSLAMRRAGLTLSIQPTTGTCSAFSPTSRTS